MSRFCALIGAGDFLQRGFGMAKRRMHGTWILYLIPPFLVAYGLVWLMRDVWNWF